MLAAKPDDLSSLLRTHVEKEKSYRFSSDLHTWAMPHTFTQRPKTLQTDKCKNKGKLKTDTVGLRTWFNQ